jgi:PKD repeat protein
LYETPGEYDVSLEVSNPDGSDMILKEGYITVDPSGIKELITRYSLRVFPNPTQGDFTLIIKSQQEKEVEFYLNDILGRAVQLEKSRLSTGESVFEFDISSYPNGIYLLTVEIDEDVIPVKVLKEE